MPIGIIVIQTRFCGPENSGNGGYVSGLIAKQLKGPVQVTLRQPPPLNQPLTLEEKPGREIKVFWQDQLIAEAQESRLDLDIPRPPSLTEARDASRKYIGSINHAFPNCFVCGPARKPGDGLRIFPGAVGRDQIVAAPWIPAPDLGGKSGFVRSEFVWSALDCPGYFAVIGDKPVPMLLGRLTANVGENIEVGQGTIVIGWPISHSGRKHIAGTALFSSEGILLAQAESTWIEMTK